MDIKDFIKSSGYDFEPAQLDGQFHEFSDSLGNKGWYIGTSLSSGKPTFTFGDWRLPGKTFSFTPETLSGDEQQEYFQAQEKFKHEKQKRQEQAKSNIQEIFTRWSRLGSSGESEYLKNKSLPTRPTGTITKPDEHGRHMLVIPMYDEYGTLWNIQSIFDSGEKQFFNFGRLEGLSFTFSGSGQTVLCEGFATGQSIHEATGFTVIVCFVLSNLKKVLEKYPHASLACDFDGATYKKLLDENHKAPHNPGIQEGIKLAKLFDVNLYSPVDLPNDSVFQNIDFNDLWISGGKAAVEARFKAPVDLSFVAQSTGSHGAAASGHNPQHFDKDGTYVGDLETFQTGFHFVEITKTKTNYIPCFEDLRKYFERKTNYKILGDSKICFQWNGKFYEPLGDVFIESFAQTHFEPKANNHKINEFLRLVLRTNVMPTEFFLVTKKINFANGYLDLETKTFQSHSKNIGFRYALPYDYNPEAVCPDFEKFLDRVTLSDLGLKTVLLEFMGYALSGDSCWAQKALVLTGGGSNGKSTFMNIMRDVGGENSHTPMTLNELRNEYKLQLLDGKLFNMAEETPSKSLLDSSVFKNIVGGGVVIVRQIYKAPYQTKIKAKLIFACNELPKSDDTTHAFYRRFFIVPFRATFSPDQPDFDPFIEEKLKKELPGIFNLLLKSYFDLKKRGRFEENETLLRAVEEFKDMSDPLRYWLKEAVEVHPLGNGHDDTWVSNQELYTEFKLFCDEAELPQVNRIDFGRKISRLIDAYHDRLKFAGPKDERVRGLVAITKASGKPFPSNKLRALRLKEECDVLITQESFSEDELKGENVSGMGRGGGAEGREGALSF